ncbi:hypothetical protein, partial [Muribaculum intestinale]|uniref:hypothetical protein n=1 Tax=Muribaculum intestinale TaxID=1796646 RepID=UPI0025A53D54
KSGRLSFYGLPAIADGCTGRVISLVEVFPDSINYLTRVRYKQSVDFILIAYIELLLYHAVSA